ncbi:TIGR03085 family protein [Corynebacterium sp. 13CS0277]|uniref:TIGR03085 family metal-binding protein n=1 Tax=Corynebacterium sp. 13CS0277 TaxID=2071994 RepID=UPI000D04490D|nr:TIGR03085 family metal-binding protein [Corynebacterium sp. 13CS0277]PRQ10534.1 TIGR03085 family protein [Corynebacterium sp. 13CS0277]
MSLAATTRADLARLLLNLGPDAPTLCEGWTTRDLAVHLLVRETRPDAAAGMFLPPLGRHLAQVTAATRAGDFSDVARRWAAGPHGLARVADRRMNTVEHFVHLEDVRRAQQGAEPLALSSDEARELHRAAVPFVRMLLRTSTAPVVLVPRGLPRIVCADRTGVVTRGSAPARVVGTIGEIVLWAFGRDVAAVEVDDPAGVVRRASA